MRHLGVDYGDRRIGLALSDASGSLARPWKTIARVGNPQQVATQILDQVLELARNDEPVAAIVVGYPRRLSGDPTHQTGAVETIVERLRAVAALPVILQDERLSSREADDRLARSQKDWRKRKAQVDAMAAAIILQDYLDSGSRAAGAAEEGES